MKAREETEFALQDAALRLMERDGVLAGLNLSELAEQASVNRGLVYHYFGSRQELLRAALRRDYSRRIAEVRAGAGLGFRARWTRLFRTLVRHRAAIRIATLLHLDRDSSLRMMPIRNETRERLLEEQAAGRLPADLDLDALHVGLNAFMYGYALFRDRFARELGRSVRDLDRSVEELLSAALGSLEAEPEPPVREAEAGATPGEPGGGP